LPVRPAVPVTLGPAVARQDNINVRGRAAIDADVVTRLKRDERVTVLEEITLPKPRPDEPDKWVRIALPSGLGVWVHGDYLDPVKHTVKATRLNLRSGPGENYSILGRLEQGAVVKPIETKGDWIKIETPAEASAFVAAHLLAPAPAAAPPVVAMTAPTPSVASPAPVVAPPPMEVPPVEAPATIALPDDVPTVTATTGQPIPVLPEVTPPPPVVETNLPVPAPPPVEPTVSVTGPPVIVPPIAEPEPAVMEEPVAPEVYIPRIVTREGLVKRSASIQAPSYFELESLDTRKTINYLHSTNANVLLRDYRGQRIIVTGEEILDERWPHTPVISVDTIRAMP
jgi:hypothetical protein